MKKFAAAVAIGFSTLLALAAPAAADSALTYSSSVVNGVLAATQSVDLDLNRYRVDDLSVQLVYSSASPNTVTFTDGHTSTGNITISSLSGLTTAYATGSITVISTTGLSGMTLTVNGNTLKEGGAWFTKATTHLTAVDIARALNKDYADIVRSTVTPTGSVVYSTATNYGMAGNSITLTTSISGKVSVSGANLTGGRDHAVLTLAGIRFTANSTFAVASTSSGTATNLASAINNSGLGDMVRAAAASNIVYATSTTAGYAANYAMVSSTPAALTVSAANMSGGIDSDVNLSAIPRTLFGFSTGITVPGPKETRTSVIKKATTGVGPGTAFLWSTTAGTIPAPFVAGTTYYATNITAADFQLSDTSTGALAGLNLSITTQTRTGGGTFVLTPIALAGTPAFKIQMSNDGTNFSDLYFSSSTLLAPAQCAVSFASPYTASSQFWPFGPVNFKWLRFAFTKGTWGGVNINCVVNGKKR